MTDMIQMTKFILNDKPSGEESSPFVHSKFLNKTPFHILEWIDLRIESRNISRGLQFFPIFMSQSISDKVQY